MHRRIDPSPELLRLADLQGGLVTREQATSHGVGLRSQQRLVEQGIWTPRAPSVLSTHRGREDFIARAWLGSLSADGGVLAEHAAGHLLGLVPEPPSEIVVHVTRWCRRRAPDGVRFVRVEHARAAHGMLPHTGVEQTVVDLCAADPGRMVEWVTTALRHRLTTPPRLREEVEQRHRLPARPPVRQRILALLEDAEGVESVLEKLFVDRVLRPHGFPRGERQFRRGRSRHDLRLGPVLVELDGRAGHSSSSEVFRDLARDNAAAVDGFVTLRFGHEDCWERPCEAAAQLDAVLRRLGVDPGTHPCPACRRRV